MCLASNTKINVASYLQTPEIVEQLEEAPYEVLGVYKRNDPSFVQGLYWDTQSGRLVESTGLYGKSITQWLSVDEKKKNIRSELSVPFPAKQFGEGIAPLDDNRFIELTWLERTVRILDRDTLQELASFAMWPGVKEGWGITLDPVN